jgi:hypothetical protein
LKSEEECDTGNIERHHGGGTTLLTWKMEKGAPSRGLQMASRSQEAQEMAILPYLLKEIQSHQH